VVEDTFQGGTSFQQVIDLYLFDKSLRSLYLDAIECIEVGLRVEIALRLGARNRFAVYSIVRPPDWRQCCARTRLCLCRDPAAFAISNPSVERVEG
jgi:hypothetical protein